MTYVLDNTVLQSCILNSEIEKGNCGWCTLNIQKTTTL